MAKLEPVVISIETQLDDKATPKLKESVKHVDAYTQSLLDLQKQFKTLSSTEAEPTLRLEDEASGPLSQSRKDLTSIDKKRATPEVGLRDQASQPLREVETKVNKLNREKATVGVGANDGATSIITRVKQRLEDFSGKHAEGFMSVKDGATASIERIKEQATGLVKKSWDVTVGVIDKATQPLKGVYNWLTSIQGLVTTVFAGAAFDKLVMSPVGLADFYTTAETGFATMLGSVEKAQKMMDDINEFAITTPFKAQGLVDTSQKMLAMGWTAEDILPDLNDIGNAMAALGKGDEGIERVTLALSQMRAKGKVSAEEMNQLTEAGIGAWNYLSKSIGVSTAEAQDMVSKGLIPVDDAIRGIIGGMKEYDGFMVKTANDTVNGLLSQIEDSFSVNVVKPWGKGLADGLKPGLAEINNMLGGIFDSSDRVQTGLQNMGESIGSFFGNTASSIAKTFSGIFSSFEFQNASLAGKVEILIKDGIEKPVSNWWNSGGKETVTDIATQGMEVIGNVVKEGIPVLIEAAFSNPITATMALAWGAKLGGNLVSGLTSSISGGKKAINGAKDIFKGVSNLKRVGFSGFTDAVKEAGSLTGALKSIGSASAKAGDSLLSTAENTAQLSKVFNSSYKESGSLVTAFKSVQTASSSAGSATSGFTSILGMINPVTLGVTASIAALGAAFIHFKSIADHALDSYSEEIKKTDELIDRNKSLTSSIKNNIESRKDSINSFVIESVQAKTLADRIYDLNESQEQSAQSHNEMLSYVEKLNQLYPDLNIQYDESTQRLIDEEGAIYATRDALREKISALKDAAVAQSAYNIMSEASTDYMKSVMEMPALEKEVGKYQSLFDDAKEKFNSRLSEGINPWNYKDIMEAQAQVKGFKEELDKATDAYNNTKESAVLAGDQIVQSAQLAGTDGAAYLQQLNNEMVNSGTVSEDMASTITSSFYNVRDEALTAGADAGNNYASGLSSTEQTLRDSANQTFEYVRKEAENKGNEIAAEGTKAGNSWLSNFKNAMSSIGSWISSKVSSLGNILHGGGLSQSTPGIAGTIPHRAEGGIMDSAHLALVAEDGPEAIIPLGNKRRSKGVKLWEEAGRRLGVYAHAEGGISSGGGSGSSSNGDFNASTEVEADFSTANNEVGGFLRNFQKMTSGLVSEGSKGFSQVESIIANSTKTDTQTFNAFVNTFNTRAQQGLGIQFPVIVNSGMDNSVMNVQNGTNGMYVALQSGEGPFYGEGQTLMTLLNSGINSRRSDVVSSASSLVTELKARFEEGLGIHSPSRYMKWVGEMMMSGLIGGLSGERLDLLIDSMIGDMKTSFQAGTFDPYQLVNYLGNDSTVALMGRIADIDMSDLSSGSWVYPVQGTPYHENAPFHEPRGNRVHQGIDLMASHGVPILSVMPGTVTYSGGAGGTGYGNHVIVDHGNGFETVYAHFMSNSVGKGDQVASGQQLGLADSTGNSTGDHLHFELWDQASGVEQDPTNFLQGASFTAGNPLVNAIQQAYNSINGIGGTTSGSIPWDFSAGVSQWLPLVQQALDITGQSRGYANDILWAIQNESGGNPNAINDWDSNAAMGDPSRGLMQTIGSTFNAYRNPNLSANIYDPLSNIVAGINYMLSRYGSIEAVVGPRRGKWYGYATGTDYATPGLHWVGENGPELLQFRGGERVYTAEESKRIAQGTKLSSVNGISVDDTKTSVTNTVSKPDINLNNGAVQITINVQGNNAQEISNELSGDISNIANQILEEIARQYKDVTEGSTIGGTLA